MKVKQIVMSSTRDWCDYSDAEPKYINPQLVIFFGSNQLLSSEEHYNSLQKQFPNAVLIGCSTAGEIIGDEVLDDSIVASAIEFKKTELETATVHIDNFLGDSYKAGVHLANKLNAIADLKAVFALSDGQKVNGSDLVSGITSVLGHNTSLTGGFAADGSNFRKTLVGCNTVPESGRIVLIGFYGQAINVRHGCAGGWDTFGKIRTITHSKANILYTLDNKPALDLYKEYLAEKADELPGSALLLPMMIRPAGQTNFGTIRTIKAIDETKKTLIFSGNIPEGFEAQLMMANFDRLVDGASKAAEKASTLPFTTYSGNEGDILAVLISCLGRKMTLGQRVGDEAESIQSLLGKDTKQMGFYSYGEISPHTDTGLCEFQNQTMTITTFFEQ